MAIIKSYTDLSQSKKLAKILPLESADMFYNEESEDETYPKDIVDTEYPMILREEHKHLLEEYGIPCWSLASLLGFLPEFTLQRTNWENKTEYKIVVYINDDTYASKNYDNPIDAVCELILNLL